MDKLKQMKAAKSLEAIKLEIRTLLTEINDKESLDMFEEIKDTVDEEYLNKLLSEVKDIKQRIDVKTPEPIPVEPRRKNRKLKEQRKDYNKCSVCEANCRKSVKGEDGLPVYYCCRHHPESIKKRGENQLRYYKTDKGLEAYTRVYLKKQEKKKAPELKS